MIFISSSLVISSSLSSTKKRTFFSRLSSKRVDDQLTYLFRKLKAQLIYVFSVRFSKNIKTERASKSSHFRSDNQRQISLVLSHTCRNRKRLINLTNSQTFFEIIRLARCEYSKLVSVYSFSKGCAYIRRGVCSYPEGGVRLFKEMCSYLYSSYYLSIILMNQIIS